MKGLIYIYPWGTIFSELASEQIGPFGFLKAENILFFRR
jgi:hypothetical protein